MKNLVVVIIFLLSVPIVASNYLLKKVEDRTEKKNYTLAQILEKVKSNNENYLISKENLSIKKADYTKSWGYFLPKLKIGGALKRNFPKTEIPFSVTGGTDNVIVSPELEANALFSATMPVLNAAAILKAEGAKLNQEIEVLNHEKNFRDTRLAISVAYITAFQDFQAYELSKRQHNRSISHKNSVKDRVRGGVGKLLELERANLEVLKSKNASNLMEQKYLTSLGKLGLLVGITNEFNLVAPDMAFQQFELLQNQLIKYSQKNRLDQKISNLKKKIAEKATSGQLLSYLPTLDATAEARYTSNASGFNPHNWTGAIALNGSWNIFDGGIREAELRKTQAQSAQVKIQSEALKRNIEAEVRHAFETFTQSQAQLDLAAQSFKLAESIQRETTSQYLAGITKSLDVIDANLNLFNAELELDKAKHNLLISKLKLLNTSGHLSQT